MRRPHVLALSLFAVSLSANAAADHIGSHNAEPKVKSEETSDAEASPTTETATPAKVRTPKRLLENRSDVSIGLR